MFAESGVADPVARKPLVLLRDTERSLRRKTLNTIAPVLPESVALQLGEAAIVADESLNTLAKIDLDQITDAELRPVRIKVGLLFVGFGALAMVFLMLFLAVLHPELNSLQQAHDYWLQYVWLVSFGVAGMFMLGREAMRPDWEQRSSQDSK
jgi:hypothetical protein